ncbi:MAG: hypothetical protein HQK83_19105, partial [Fibrobacteria bacterium]|nr:hypothetical protein [Fibrobacteria bacterium]
DINNIKWIKHGNVSASGAKGTTDWVTISAARVPFNYASTENNRVMFKIRDTYAGGYFRSPRVFKRGFKVSISSLDWSNLNPDGVVSEINPDFTIYAQSPDGLDVSSVVCEYSVDGGGNWQVHTARCSGKSGSKRKETVSVENVPFVQDGAKGNKIRFSIKTSDGTLLKSAEYPVKLKLAPEISDLKQERQGASVDFTMSVNDTGGLRVGSQENGLNEETVIYFPLNENADDLSGNGFDGELIGNVSFKNTDSWKSKMGQEKMLYFDGSGGYVDAGYGYMGRSRSFCISAWVKAENGGPAIAVGGINTNESLVFSFKDGYVQINANDAFNTPLEMSSPAGSFSYNKWHHITFTWKGSHVSPAKLFINGNLVAEKLWNFNGWLLQKLMPFRLGVSVNGSDYYKGYLDEVQLVSRVLSEKEIAAAYYSGAYRYTTDGGSVWSDWMKGVFDVDDDAKTAGILSLSAVPFSENADSLNRIQVVVRDVNGNAVVKEYLSLPDGAVLGMKTVLEPVLFEVSPNPFRYNTNISFTVTGQPQTMELSIYDISGTKVRQFGPVLFDTGTHSFTWDGTGEYGQKLSFGSYLAVFRQGNQSYKRLMMFLN